jgi:hypothetical protein
LGKGEGEHTRIYFVLFCRLVSKRKVVSMKRKTKSQEWLERDIGEGKCTSRETT